MLENVSFCLLLLLTFGLIKIYEIIVENKNHSYCFCLFLFTESRVFDESEDEYEDDYTESLKVIRDLDKKIEEKRKSNEPQQQSSKLTVASAPAASQAMEKKSSKSDRPPQNRNNAKKLKTTHDAPQTSNSAVRTRPTNQPKPTSAENKITETNIVYDPNGQMIEVLSVLEDFGDDEQGTTEYIIADDIESAFETDEPFQTNDSNDEELEALIAKSEQQYENETFALQSVAKSDELFISEESTDDMKDMDDNDDDDVDDDTGKKKTMI